MQLVSSPHSLTPVTALSLVPAPLTSSPVALRSQAYPKLLSPLDFHREWNTGQAFLNSCALYICLAVMTWQNG